MIYQIISSLAHNCQNYQYHKSLELRRVVKRVVLVFLFAVVVVHPLINKGTIHPNSYIVEAC